MLNAGLTLPGTRDLTLSGVISGGSGLIKQGASTLTLGSANTYAGGTTLAGGTLLAGDDGALGSGALSVSGDASLGSSNGDRSLTNAIALAVGHSLSALTGTSDTLTLGGTLSGDGSLLKRGTGTLVLAGSNSYTGGTRVVDGGTLRLGSDGALGSGALTLDAATLLDSTGNRVLANAIRMNAGLTLAGGFDLTLSGPLSGAGGLTKAGSGDLTLSGANSYAGGTSLGAGSLTLGNDLALGTGALSVTGNAALVDAGVSRLANAIGLGTGATLALTSSDGLVLDGVVSGDGALSKSGAGLLTLNGTNTYAGGTTVNAGGLMLGSDSALGSGLLTLAGATTLDGSAARTLANGILLNAGLTLPGNVDFTLNGAIAGTGGLTKQGNATLTLGSANSYGGGTTLDAGKLVLGDDAALGSGGLTVSGAASLDGTQALSLGNTLTLGANLTLPGSHDLALNGAIDGAGALIKQGTSTLTLGAANTYAGGTTLAGGSLLLGNDGALGSGTLSVTGNASLGNATAGLRIVANAVDLAVNRTLSLITASGSDITLGGTISGTGNLAKSGTGTLLLTGSNTYSGQTQINGGTLALGNNAALGSSALLVLGASSLTGTGNLQLANDLYLGSDLTLTGSNDLILDGTVGGAGVLIKNSSGILELNGNNNNFNGIQLNAGNLRISTDTALGTGALSVNADATLSSTGNLSLNNAITLASGSELTTDTADDLSLNGLISGLGGLIKSGSGTLYLNGANSYAGGTSLSNGLLVLGDDLALGSGRLTVTGNGSIDASAVRVMANDILFTNDLSLTVAGSNNLTLNGVLSGPGTLIKEGNGSLTLGGANSYGDGTLVNGGTVYATSVSLPGDVNVASGARLEFSQNSNGSYAGLLTGSGTLAKSGSGVLTLVDGNAFTGLVDVLAGSLLTSGNGVVSGANEVRVDGGATLGIGGAETLANLTGSGTVELTNAGTSVLSLGSASNSQFAGALNGAGTLNKVGAGTLVLSGNSELTGPTHIQAGTLQVDGTLASGAINLSSGATLSGIGNMIGTVTVNGGTIAGDQTRGTLSVGNLVLSSGSQVNLNLGAPNGGSLIDVNGDLTLDGTLNITDAGAMGLGVYTLFTYDGQFTDNGLAYGSLPPVMTSNFYELQTGFNKQVNLLVQGAPNQVLFWNGNQTSPTGSIGGGAGTWSTTGTNWTNGNGNIATDWQDTFAVFGGVQGSVGSPLVVSVDGQQNFIGLQFLTDGYQLSGANAGSALVAVNGSGGTTDLRVNSGLTATLAVDIDGSGRLNKLDGGTLILSGDNGYSGSTRFGGGVVQVDADTRLGAASGDLEFAGGTLRITGTGYTGTARDIALDAAGGTLDIADAGNVFTLGQVITGAGGLIKLGNGTLVLNGINTYGGGTILGGGTLVLGNVDAIGNGALSVTGGTLQAGADLSLGNGGGLDNAILLNGALTVNGAQNLGLAGTLSGIGSLVKAGSGTLELSGSNGYSGGTWLNAGTLVVNSNGALGSGVLHTADGTSLDAGQAVTLANGVDLVGNLNLPGSNNLSLNGVVTGSGGLIKSGLGTLTLGAGNSYAGGTTLNAGTLAVGANGALGSGTLLVNGGALDSTTAVTLLNAISLASDLNLVGSHDLTLDGTVSGAGGLDKNGTGTLVLNGSNTYGGGTDLNGGSLVVGSNTALGSGALIAANGTSLDSNTAVTLGNAITLAGAMGIAGSHDLTLNGLIGGAGSLVKSGPGVLVLNNANTYTGGTSLGGGTLVVGDNSALGSGALTVTGNAALDSNAPNLVLTNAIGLQGTLTDLGSQNLTLQGDITGNGGLVKQGPGTLTLTGDNSYSGGTSLQGGTLAGNSDSLQGNIDTAIGTLIDFIQNASGTFNGSISGSGAVVKDGTGNLLLSGGNSYTGGTTINAGTLTGDSSSLQGDIQINLGGTLVFDQSGNGVYAGGLSGNGDLVKQGNGALSLTGTSNIGGSTYINGGSLLVEGSLNSDLVIGAGGSLGGGGSVSGDVTIDNGARLVAGTYLTPLSFNSDLDLVAGSQLDFYLGTPNSPTTLISVAGDLTLDGTLNINDAGGLGTGIYRLFSYGGNLTDNGLTYGNVPLGYSAGDFTLQTAIAGQINLLLQGTVGEIQFWDGGDGTGNNQIDGGSGTWNSSLSNWTDANGNSVDGWDEHFAAFAGTGGTVTVEGAQTFTGMQFLSNGYQLVAGSGGSLLASADGSGGAPRILVDNGVSASLGLDIAGSAGLVKAGAGTLVLSGNNSYSGGTTIGGGTLQVSDDSALGASGGGLTLNGGVLGVAGTSYQSTGRTITLGANGGGFDIQAAGNTFTVNQALAGTGALIKRGGGTLVLSGANTYGGGTSLQGGTLRGDTSSLQGNVVGAAGTTLEFAQNGSGTYAGIYAGAGSLLKTGSGNLTLTGANSYTGGTLISAGTLSGSTASLQGDIDNNGTLVFNQASDGVFGGMLWGAGTLIKDGSGTLLITDNQHFTGTVQVNSGSLLVGDASAQTHRLDATVAVAQGAEVGGTGTVGSLASSGTVAPGYGGSGTLNVTGSYTGAATSRLLLNLNAQDNSRLAVTQVADLGGTLQVQNVAYGGAPTTLTLLTADAGVNGTFDQTLLPSFAFLQASVNYSANSVTLDLARNATGLVSVAMTPNQGAVAAAIEQAGGGTLYNAIVGLDAEQARDAYDQLSGEAYASSVAAMESQSLMVRQAVEARMRQTCQSSSQRTCSVQNPMPLMPLALDDDGDGDNSVWAYALGGWGKVDGDDNSASLDRSTSGMMFGYDRRLSDKWRGGVTGGYSHDTVKVDARNSDLSIDSYHLGVYSSYQEGDLTLRGGALYSWHQVDSKRDIDFPGFSDHLKADYDASSWQVFGEAGYLFDLDVATVEPYLNLTHTRYEADDIDEKGGVARLQSKVKEDSTTSTLGVRAAKHINLAKETDMVVRAGLGWQHAYGDDTPEASMAFSETGGGFNSQGTPIDQDTAIVEAGVEVNIGRNGKLQLSYNGQIASESRNNEMRVEYSYRF
ncbi:autotransporter-associated beta strand repeat-containing protein [Pseudomonas sp. PDM13]|uniref:autotransporter-associated beta strand repeat-containing protein n=1 Tax=Pseudomonas sp. PDM13 TaxID=2769255 RepID=UPI0021E03F4E|nr:autotransporter-associated beta strand repeat-containing protein [Pseudomonas sp. PDM13]MCU9951105.1 autotransporter-associated beta strand repeat-containing protein [Pseudomonas sp. PDM13]